jgi:hypothetical protein
MPWPTIIPAMMMMIFFDKRFILMMDDIDYLFTTRLSDELAAKLPRHTQYY